MRHCIRIPTVLFLVLVIAAGYTLAQDIQPGVDLFETPPDGLTDIDLVLPADFFGPGSDPFVGSVVFRGMSFEQTGLSLGRTATVVERPVPAVLDSIGDSDTIPIEIVALNLVSIQPITVTYNGGMDPEHWDVQVNLSSLLPQEQGTMTITKEYDNGGTYEAILPVTPRFTFIRETDQHELVLDPAPTEYMEAPFPPPAPLPADACWSYDVPFPIVVSYGETTVDHDGNEATPQIHIGPSSNFVAGGCGFTPSGERPVEPEVPSDYRKVLAVFQSPNVRHAVQPANPLDHFRVYDVEDVPTDLSVTLHDQFDPENMAVNYVLQRIEYFSTPVDKNYEGIADINAHFIWYRLTTPEPGRRWVDVENQFARQRLQLGPAEYLLVPAEKVEEGSEFPVMLDHYKCYPVIHGATLDDFAFLVDQFFAEDVTVTKPVFFCNPVDKNGEGIIDEVDHLVFYEIDQASATDPIMITANDQFASYDLTIVASTWLGLPSKKVQWGSPTDVGMTAFDATKFDGRVEVSWTTSSEESNGGFNIHRGLDRDGPRARINDELIPAKGTELEGASYVFTDVAVVDGIDYYYWIESIDLSGGSAMHGPVLAAAAEESRVPAAFGLSQNHPNPFNPVTEIMYNLPVDCHVRLDVYDVLGRRVATLVDDFQKAGFRSARWQAGPEFSSGVYFYKLRAGTFVETRRMVLLR